MEESENKGDKYFSLVNLGIDKILLDLYKDLAKPGVRKVGQALATVLDLCNVLVIPIKYINQLNSRTDAIFANNMEKYRKNLESVPEKNICEVAPEIGVPIIEKLTYTSNEEISNAFINLLTKASSIDTARLVHPAYIDMISRMSKDEAKIIKYLQITDVIPYITYNIHRKGKSFLTLDRYLTAFEYKVELDFKENMGLYLDNLLNLGILQDLGASFLKGHKLYDDIRKHYLDKEEKYINENSIGYETLVQLDDEEIIDFIITYWNFKFKKS